MIFSLKYKFLYLSLFVTLLSSFGPLGINEIYILPLCAVIAWFIIPITKVWDKNIFLLFLFSLFYVFIIYFRGNVKSYFALIFILLSPIFYRIGSLSMEIFRSEKSRLILLFLLILSYLIFLFVITYEDIVEVGFINPTRVILLEYDGDEYSMAATLYGLAASTGIGCISMIFANNVNLFVKYGLILLSVLSMLVVIHLVNRTGVILFTFSILFSYYYSSKASFSRFMVLTGVLLVFIILFLKSGVIDKDILDAYESREDRAEGTASELGGRGSIWIDAITQLYLSPIGWDFKHYAHNLWLDIARAAGWLPFISFIVVSINIVRDAIFIFNKGVTPFRLLILTILISVLVNSFVEPVIEGSKMFFSILLIIFGMISTVRTQLN